MAQTKRKRQTKHRGNAAGKIETRGRTGRKPTDDERKHNPKQTAQHRREASKSKPPPWAGASQRASPATVLFVIAPDALSKKPIIWVSAHNHSSLLLYGPM